MPIEHYILDGHVPRAASFEDYVQWRAELRATRGGMMFPHVGYHVFPDHRVVSTVFTGMNQNYGSEGPPLLFETMILGGEHDGYQVRTSTWQEAEEAHAKALDLADPPAKLGRTNNDPPDSSRPLISRFDRIL